MASKRSPLLHRRSRRIGIAMLASAAALLGGAQALAPTPAVAMVDSGGQPCSSVSWFDQFNCVDSAEDGGGGGGSSGGEVIHVSGVAPKPKCSDDGVICIPLGPGKPGPPDPDSRPPRDGTGRGHQLQPNGSDKGHPVCTKPSTGKEAGVCPGSPGKKKPQKPRDLLAEELKQARLCRQIQSRLRKYRRYQEEIDVGQIDGEPILEDSPAGRQELRELMDLSIKAEEQEARKYQCHLQRQL
jgi:hypothetical protein